MVLWKARNAAVRIDSAVTISASTTLYAHLGALQFESAAMNVSVKEPEGGTEEVQLLGEDSNGYQNEELDELRKGKASLTMDLLEGNKNILQHLVDTTTTSGAAAGYTRYNYGDDTVTKRSVALNIADGTDTATVLLNNARLVSPGEVSVDGKGHVTRKGVKFECLARDYWAEIDINN